MLKASIQTQLEQTLTRRLKDLPPYVDEFIYALKNSKKIRTRLEYTKDIHLFFDYLHSIGRVPSNYRTVSLQILNELSTRNIQEFLDYLTYYEKTYLNAKGQELTQSFQNQTGAKSRKLATLREWFRFMEKRKMISQNVVRDVEFQGPKNILMKDTLQQGELQKLLDFLQSEETAGQKNYAPQLKQRDYMIVLILGYTGIRVSELIQLDRVDVQLQKQHMVIYRKGGKAQRIPLSPKLISEFEIYFNYRNSLTPARSLDKEAVFLSRDGKRLTDQSVRKLLDKYGKAIQSSTKLTPHVLRRTFGTEHYNRYGDMDLTATVLGHSSTETTRKHYARVDETRIRASLEDFDYQ